MSGIYLFVFSKGIKFQIEQSAKSRRLWLILVKTITANLSFLCRLYKNTENQTTFRYDILTNLFKKKKKNHSNSGHFFFFTN